MLHFVIVCTICYLLLSCGHRSLLLLLWVCESYTHTEAPTWDKYWGLNIAPPLLSRIFPFFSPPLEQKASPGKWSLQMVGILNTFCEQTYANNLHFHVFLVQVASAHGVRFLLCWWLMIDRPTLFSYKTLSFLRTWMNKNIMLIFCIV